MGDTLGLPQVGQTPAEQVFDEVRTAYSILVARGILWRAITLLVANEPKPWSPRIKQLRSVMAQAHGILADSWEVLPHALQTQALERFTARPRKDALARHRTRLRGERE